MDTSRRRFLASLGGAPLVFGLRGLVAQDKPESRPSTKPESKDPFAAALASMAESDAPGLGFVLPDSDAARGAILERLTFWCAGSSARAAALHLRAVLVVAPRQLLPASQDDAVVLFDRAGARCSGLAQAIGKRTSREDLLALHALLDDYEAARRKRTKIASPEPGETELERLLQQSPDRPLEEALVAKVALHCVPGGYPIWRWRGAMSSLERDVAARPILAAFQRRIGTDKALPFGIAFGEETKMLPTGCGTSDDTDPEVGMPMIACGMGILRARSLKLLEVTGRQR